MTDQVLEFWWPSLVELNDNLSPFYWSSEEEQCHYLLGDTILTLPAIYTGPPPSTPTYCNPTMPMLSNLTQSIIQSSNSFFISPSIGTNEACEWQLVRLVLQESMSLYPSCLQDGHFLVKFYISHPADLGYNVINTHFWLQYHTLSILQFPLSMMGTHFIWPSDSLEDYATQHKHLPFRKWVNLTHKTCSSMVLLNSPLSTAGKLEIISPTKLGHPQSPLWYVPQPTPAIWCAIKFNSCQLWCTHDVSHWCHLPSTNNFGTSRVWLTRCAHFSLTKDHDVTSKPPQFFEHHYKGASLEVWYAEVDQLDVHFARKSVKSVSV